MQDGFKNKVEEEENSEMLQKNSKLIQKFNKLNISDTESDKEADGQNAPIHETAPSEPERNADLPREWRIPRNLSLDNIIGQIGQGVSTRRTLNHFCENMSFVSQIKSSSVDIALNDDKWVDVMHDELN